LDGKVNYSGIYAFRHHSSDLEISPNPVDDKLHVSLKVGPDAHLMIKDLTGKVLFESEVIETSCVLNLHQFLPGIYLLEVHSENKVFVKKLLKN
jgi:hypothetical protein